MSRTKDNRPDIVVELITDRETDKAFLVRVVGVDNTPIWLPKSQLKVMLHEYGEGQDFMRTIMPQWLYDAKCGDNRHFKNSVEVTGVATKADLDVHKAWVNPSTYCDDSLGEKFKEIE